VRGDIQVLEVTTRELLVRDNLNLSLTSLLDLNSIAEVSNTAIDLDLILKKLLEGVDIENLVAGGLRGVDDELSQLASFFNHHLLSRLPYTLCNLQR